MTPSQEGGVPFAGDQLEAGRSYEHAYFMVVDASGHSTVVRENPRDKANDAFDLLEIRVRDRIERIRQKLRCQYAETWGWQGDGGLFLLWDPSESIANRTSMDAGRTLLSLDLPQLRQEFSNFDIRGELHLRVSLHRGTLTYLGAQRRGSIHSPDLNFAAHLEKACPRDCMAISRPVYEARETNQNEFFAVGMFEDQEVLLFAPGMSASDAKARWMTEHGMPGSLRIQAMPERPSQQQKSEYISTARTSVIDLGTALRTCSNYLVTTERPRWYRERVKELLARGVVYDCYVFTGGKNPIDPSEDLSAKVTASLQKLSVFKGTLPEEDASRFRVFGSDVYPGFAALAVDLTESEGSVIYSPYLPTPPGLKELERGDMPHYMVSSKDGSLFQLVSLHTRTLVNAESAVQLL